MRPADPTLGNTRAASALQPTPSSSEEPVAALRKNTSAIKAKRHTVDHRAEKPVPSPALLGAASRGRTEGAGLAIKMIPAPRYDCLQRALWATTSVARDVWLPCDCQPSKSEMRTASRTLYFRFLCDKRLQPTYCGSCCALSVRDRLLGVAKNRQSAGRHTLRENDTSDGLSCLMSTGGML